MKHAFSSQRETSGLARAALPLLLLLTLLTQTGCLHTAYVSDKINQTMAQNSGTLVAAPGMQLNEVLSSSTLDLGKGVGNNGGTSKSLFFIDSIKFDWQLPNSQLLVQGLQQLLAAYGR